MMIEPTTPRLFRMKGARVVRSSSWRQAPLTLTIALAGLLALLLSGCDPGYGVSAVNQSDTDLVLRSGTDKWDLPARSSGHIFGTLGLPEEAAPITYEILDAETCDVLATQRVVFSKVDDEVIVVAGDLSAGMGSPGTVIDASLASTESCPGSADGWTFWIVNHTATTFYVRMRGDTTVAVSVIRPTSGAVAFWSHQATSTIELLDTDCKVLDSHEQQGFGYTKGTIDGTKLTLTEGIRPVDDINDYGSTELCHE